MASILKERILIGEVACGPTYRESAYKQLKDYYFDDDNIFYYILTDDKSYFDSLERKNLVVKELEDYYSIFPEIEPYEKFLKSTSKEDYATKFIETDWKFPFSTYRFILHQAIQLEITNIAMMCTDSFVGLETIANSEKFFTKRNRLYVTVSQWDVAIWNCNMHEVAKRLEAHHKLIIDSPIIRVYDQAGRIFIAKDLDQVKKLFEIWHDVTVFLWKNNLQGLFKSSYVYADEHVVAPIYHVLGINRNNEYESPEEISHWNNSHHRIMIVKHNGIRERFWVVMGQNPDNMKHFISAKSYDDFLKLNNMTEDDVERLAGWKQFCENRT